jgi:hypothetical protein
MKIEPRTLIAPLLAGLVLVVTLNQTLGALKDSGSWRTRPRGARVIPGDPYAYLDGLLAVRGSAGTEPAVLRNPLRYANTPAPVAVRSGTPRRVVPPAPPRPVLTAIIWDNDPRATIRYEGRDYSVRENSSFAEFIVRSISNTQVVLERNGAPMVLSLRSKGE